MQAELGPEGDDGPGRWDGVGDSIDDLKTYRAEWNVWAYYCEFLYFLFLWSTERANGYHAFQDPRVPEDTAHT